jgi:hypothetical protein
VEGRTDELGSFSFLVRDGTHLPTTSLIGLTNADQSVCGVLTHLLLLLFSCLIVVARVVRNRPEQHVPI